MDSAVSRVPPAFAWPPPVIVLAPSASRDHQYRNSTQEFDQVSLFRPITKAAFPINKIERLPDALRHAFRVATSGKMGPVMLDIPRDLLPGGAFNERYVGADTSNPRYDKYAELFGATGFYVERAEDVGDAFLEALKAEGPSIIEIPTDPEEMPRPARLADVQAPQTGS
jgi:thiamine pyrophosphate-dependent acetolactate synthase large subunit-like protein